MTRLLTLIETETRPARFDHREENVVKNLVADALDDEMRVVDVRACRLREASPRAICERFELLDQVEARCSGFTWKQA